MIAISIFVLAAVIGVVLAVVDGPYSFDRKLVERISIATLAAGAVVLVAGAVVLVRATLLS